jgi:site-specific recombinase XerD
MSMRRVVPIPFLASESGPQRGITLSFPHNSTLRSEITDYLSLGWRVFSIVVLDEIPQNSYSVNMAQVQKNGQAGRRVERVIAFLTQDEMRRLFGVIRSKRDRALFLVAYRHGLRASEIGLLQRTDVDMKQGRIAIHRLKGSISGVYPMQPDVVKMVRSYVRTRVDESPYLFVSNRNLPIGRFMVLHLMRVYGERAGIPERKREFHCLKHSIATHLLDAGADLAFVKDWLGHANIQNTTIYARLTTATRDAQARKVFASHRVV